MADPEEPITVPWVPDASEEWVNIVRPVTIFQLHQAEDSPIFDDKCFMIDGRGFGQVTVVAHVVATEVRAATCVFTLEDGTGRIRASKTLDSIRGFPSEEEEAAQCNALAGTFVEVCGTPRRFKGRISIDLQSIRKVVNYNQVLYHTLHVIHANVLIERHVALYDPDSDSRTASEGMDVRVDGPAPTPVAGPTAPQQVAYAVPCVDSSDVSMDTIMASPPSTPPIGRTDKGKGRAYPDEGRKAESSWSPRKRDRWAGLPPLQLAIIEYIHHAQHESCVPITDILGVIEASHECSKEEFSSAIEELLAEAYITSPLDDDYVMITPR